MSIEDMKTYLALCLKGQATIPERKAILEKQRRLLLEKISELQRDIEYIDSKEAYYDGVLSGKIKYTSNIINVDGE